MNGAQGSALSRVAEDNMYSEGLRGPFRIPDGCGESQPGRLLYFVMQQKSVLSLQLHRFDIMLCATCWPFESKCILVHLLLCFMCAIGTEITMSCSQACVNDVST